MTTSPVVGSPAVWARDFALMGVLCGFLAPLFVIFDPVFAVMAGLAAGVSGAAIGAASGWIMERVRGAVPLAVLIPAMAVVGSLWGALAGTLGGAAGGAVGIVFGPEAIFLGFIVGGCSGMVAMALFFPLYLVASVNERAWVAMAMGAVASPLVGWAGLAALCGSVFGLWLFVLPLFVGGSILLDRSERRARLAFPEREGLPLLLES